RSDQGERHAAHDDQRQHGRAVAAVKDRENERKRQQRENPDGAAGVLLRLKGAFEAGEESLRQRGSRDLLPARGDHFSEVRAGLRVGDPHDTPAAVLAKDLVGPIGLLDLRNLPRRNPAARRLDQEVAQAAGGAHAFGEPHGHIETAIAVGDARDDTAVGEPAQLLDHGGGLHAIERGAAIVDADIELRNANLLFELQVDKPQNIGEELAQVLRDADERVELVAEYFQRDLGAHARKQVIEAVRDRLPDIDCDRQHREPLAQVSDDVGLAALGWFEVDINLAKVDA